MYGAGLANRHAEGLWMTENEVWNPKYGLACAQEEVLCKKKSLKGMAGGCSEDDGLRDGTIVWRKG